MGAAQQLRDEPMYRRGAVAAACGHALPQTAGLVLRSNYASLLQEADDFGSRAPTLCGVWPIAMSQQVPAIDHVLLRQADSVASWILSDVASSAFDMPSQRASRPSGKSGADSGKGVTRLQQGHGVSETMMKTASDRVSVRSIRRGKRPAQDLCVLGVWHPACCKHFNKPRRPS